jgi:hypothetical protein
MGLPVTFGTLGSGNQPAALLDQQFAAIGALVVIPCAASGSNAINLTPEADTPAVTGYDDLAPVFTWVQPQTSTGAVTIGLTGLPMLGAYGNNGAVALGAGNLLAGFAYQAFVLSSLAAGAGGWVVNAFSTTGAAQAASIEFVIDGGGSAIATGLKGWLVLPYNLTITGATLLADQAGSIVVDVWNCTYAQYAPGTHPVAGDKITASAPPTITAASKSQDNALTGWTTSLLAGSVLAFNVNSVATVTKVTIALQVLH